MAPQARKADVSEDEQQTQMGRSNATGHSNQVVGGKDAKSLQRSS